VSETPGITNAALGDVQLEEVAVPIDIGGGRSNGNGRSNGATPLWVDHGSLVVLPAGPLPPDPGEFVGSHRLTDALAQLREYMDLLVIDAPPLLRVGDAMRLSSFVDGVIVTTQLNLIRRPMLTELRQVLETMPARKLGVVVTGSQREDSSQYGNQYGYGDAYRSEVPRREFAGQR
jgi:Mrp family chromosome partitioning ATPase